MGVALERVQFKFASIVEELCNEPDVLSQFAVWLDLRLAEYKLKGAISLDCSGEEPDCSWMNGMRKCKRCGTDRQTDRHRSLSLRRLVSDDKPNSVSVSLGSYSPNFTVIKTEPQDTFSSELHSTSNTTCSVSRKRPSSKQLENCGRSPSKRQFFTSNNSSVANQSLFPVISDENDIYVPVDSETKNQIDKLILSSEELVLESNNSTTRRQGTSVDPSSGSTGQQGTSLDFCVNADKNKNGDDRNNDIFQKDGPCVFLHVATVDQDFFDNLPENRDILKAPIEAVSTDIKPCVNRKYDGQSSLHQNTYRDIGETDAEMEICDQGTGFSPRKDANTPDSESFSNEEIEIDIESLENDNETESEEYDDPRICHCRSHRKPDDELILRDDKCRDIYVRKTVKTNQTKLGREKKLDRVYNNYHCCFVCRKLVSHIITHLKSHKNCPDVLKFNEIEHEIRECKNEAVKIKKQKNLRQLHASIRNKGDNQHNQSVIQNKKGELLISRRPAKFVIGDYGPCPLCFEWIKIGISTCKHQYTCAVAEFKDTLTSGESIVRSAMQSGPVRSTASQMLVKEVFPIMTQGVEKSVAKSDPLIIALGNHWLRRKIANKLKWKQCTSSHMLGAARILIQLQQTTGQHKNTMSDFLKPAWFNDVAACALKCSEKSADNEAELSPLSEAIKMGFDIGRLCNMKLEIATSTSDPCGKEQALKFLTLLKLEWSEKLTKLAHVIQDDVKMHNDIQPPLPTDLAQLSQHLKDELSGLDFDKQRANLTCFKRAVALTKARLLSYNKRTAEEIEAMTLDSYHSRCRELNAADQDLLGHDWNDQDEYQPTSQEVIRIRGKASGTIPILVPDDCKASLDYITDTQVRSSCGVNPADTYLFTNTDLLGIDIGIANYTLKERESSNTTFEEDNIDNDVEEDEEDESDNDETFLSVIEAGDENSEMEITDSASACNFSVKELLAAGKCRGKRSTAQNYFNQIMNDCARQSKIWKKAPTLADISSKKRTIFFQLLYDQVPKLQPYEEEIWKRLGRHLQNRRKYLLDKSIGKRSTKSSKQ